MFLGHCNCESQNQGFFQSCWMDSMREIIIVANRFIALSVRLSDEAALLFFVLYFLVLDVFIPDIWESYYLDSV